MTKEEKLRMLREKLAMYEAKHAYKMKFYRGVIHESAISELKHSEVMVLRGIIDGLKEEIRELEGPKASKTKK